MDPVDGFLDQLGDIVSPTLLGDRVVVRAPRESDKADRLAIGRHAEFVRMVGGDDRDLKPLSAGDVDGWYLELLSTHIGWVIEVDGRAVGATRLRLVDAEHGRARYSIGIFDPARWGQRIGSEATRLDLRYAFEQLDLHRVELRVLTENARAIAMYERCGFRREGVARDVEFVNGRWLSDLWMSILDHELHRGGE